MSTFKLLCDKVCSFDGLSRFVVISDAKTLHTAPVKKDIVLKCLGCGSCKTGAVSEEEKHNLYHETGADPIGSFQFNGSFKA